MRRAAGYMLALAILFFLGRALYQTWGELAASGFRFTLALPQLVVSLVLLVVAQGLAVEAWRQILLALGERLRFGLAVRIWFLSNLARYVPGNIWQVAALLAMVEEEGVSKSKAFLSQATYMLIALSIAGLLGLLLLVAHPILLAGIFDLTPLLMSAPAPIVAAAALGGLLLVLALPPMYRLIATLTGHPTGREMSMLPLTFARGLLPPTLSALMWLTQGVAFYMFITAVSETTPAQLPAFVAMNAAAYFVGYLSFVTPSGLGFREGALAWMLTLYFPTPAAVALSLVTRLWATAGELLGAIWLCWPSGRTSHGDRRGQQ